MASFLAPQYDRRAKRLALCAFLLIGIAGRAFAGVAGEESSRFRFGNAAGSLGAATAISDFDGDKKPDFAIADRSNGPGHFQVEFRIGSQAASYLDVTSNVLALDLSVRDVDSDDDQDVVLVRPITREAVGVLVNDGFGRFHQESVDSYSIPADSDESLQRPPVSKPRQHALIWRKVNPSFADVSRSHSGLTTLVEALVDQQCCARRAGVPIRRLGRAPPQS